MSVTITVRIPRRLREKIRRYGIEVSSVVRRALSVEDYLSERPTS